MRNVVCRKKSLLKEQFLKPFFYKNTLLDLPFVSIQITFSSNLNSRYRSSRRLRYLHHPSASPSSDGGGGGMAKTLTSDGGASAGHRGLMFGDGGGGTGGGTNTGVSGVGLLVSLIYFDYFF